MLKITKEDIKMYYEALDTTYVLRLNINTKANEIIDLIAKFHNVSVCTNGYVDRDISLVNSFITFRVRANTIEDMSTLNIYNLGSRFNMEWLYMNEEEILKALEENKKNIDAKIMKEAASWASQLENDKEKRKVALSKLTKEEMELLGLSPEGSKKSS